MVWLTVRHRHYRAHRHYQQCNVNTTVGVYTANSGSDDYCKECPLATRNMAGDRYSAAEITKVKPCLRVYNLAY
jgi:hypothetical protein